mmetsp:Transcript_49185/g.99904  ORF Transcript_49185/g.99904 Transcript_49185/m.99904 type:complete len:266 (-) Transcript_49185:416-1213(-)
MAEASLACDSLLSLEWISGMTAGLRRALTGFGPSMRLLCNSALHSAEACISFFRRTGPPAEIGRGASPVFTLPTPVVVPLSVCGASSPLAVCSMGPRRGVTGRQRGGGCPRFVSGSTLAERGTCCTSAFGSSASTTGPLMAGSVSPLGDSCADADLQRCPCATKVRGVPVEARLLHGVGSGGFWTVSVSSAVGGLTSQGEGVPSTHVAGDSLTAKSESGMTCPVSLTLSSASSGASSRRICGLTMSSNQAGVCGLISTSSKGASK